MREKLFSIIIPVYNAEETIERTLASLISNRDYIYEIIIVNDRCTDGTLDKIDQFRPFFDNIIVTDNKGVQGPGPARKTGMKMAKGEYVTFVDSDDCLTPSCLYYVYKIIKQNINCTVVYAKSIYYESGSFNPENVQYADNSCGGSFYRLKYLRKNNLYPHDTLYMAEDEYFNEKINIFIKHCEKDAREYTVHLDYPVYEIHHDIGLRRSFALQDWAEYGCKYHLLFMQYVVKDMLKYEKIKDILFKKLINNFFMVYYLCCCLNLSKSQKSKKFNYLEYKEEFAETLNMLNQIFDMSDEDIVKYFNYNPQIRREQRGAAIASSGVEIEDGEGIPLEYFIKTIRDQT